MRSPRARNRGGPQARALDAVEPLSPASAVTAPPAWTLAISRMATVQPLTSRLPRSSGSATAQISPSVAGGRDERVRKA